MSEQTTENLMAAFAGESQANRMYLAFAKQAEKEGRRNAARLFRAVAEAETIHAHKHFERAGKVGSTADNLRAAMAGENYETTSMYPEFAAAAEAEGNASVARLFKQIGEVEGIHEELFKSALENLETDAEELHFYVCPVCGNVELERPDRCKVCGVPGAKFDEVA